mmetsp:Transcript_94578/g.276404  ORF Transcript_94578/g.276404 Transcript_94578/m.276404 type:complete len:259 (-) Transcript_94578:301-1077(-)
MLAVVMIQARRCQAVGAPHNGASCSWVVLIPFIGGIGSAAFVKHGLDVLQVDTQEVPLEAAVEVGHEYREPHGEADADPGDADPGRQAPDHGVAEDLRRGPAGDAQVEGDRRQLEDERGEHAHDRAELAPEEEAQQGPEVRHGRGRQADKGEPPGRGEPPVDRASLRHGQHPRISCAPSLDLIPILDVAVQAAASKANTIHHVASGDVQPVWCDDCQQEQDHWAHTSCKQHHPQGLEVGRGRAHVLHKLQRCILHCHL